MSGGGGRRGKGARFTDADKARVRERLDLAELVREMAGVTLRRSGREWRGRCPFEPDSKNPTKFAVTAEYYHCFGCGRSGDVFGWLQEWGKLSFGDAVTEGARRAGVLLAADEDLTAEERAARRRQERCAEAIAALAGIAQETAWARRDEGFERFDVSALIEAGELGRLPAPDELRTRLERLNVGEAALRDAGILPGLERLGGRWMLWARRGQRVQGGRAVVGGGASADERPGRDGDGEAVIGEWGARTRGWITPAVGERRGAHAVIAGDDRLYIALRVAEEGGVYRPLGGAPKLAAGGGEGAGRGAGARGGWGMRGLEDPRRPPVLGVRPDDAGRREGFAMAVALLPMNARLRVAEIDPLPPALSDVALWRDRLGQRLDAAGLVLDWQVAVLAAQGAFGTSTGRAAARARLGAIAAVVPEGSVEASAFQEEVERLTGEAGPGAPAAAGWSGIGAGMPGSAPGRERAGRGVGA